MTHNDEDVSSFRAAHDLLVEQHASLSNDVRDAIEAARMRGANVTLPGGQPKTMLRLVSDIMHDLIGKAAALRDSHEVLARLKFERDCDSCLPRALQEARGEAAQLREALERIDEVACARSGAEYIIAKVHGIARAALDRKASL